MSVKISWMGIDSVGYQMHNDWVSDNGVNYNKGYSCTRRIEIHRGDDDRSIYHVKCKILGDNFDQPLFQCKVLSEDEEEIC